VDQLSAKYQEEDLLFGETEDIVVKGMSQITRALEKDLDIQLNTPVQTIDYTGDVIVI